MLQKLLSILLIVSTVIVSLTVVFMIVLAAGSHNASIFKNQESIIYLSFIVIALIAAIQINIFSFQKDLQKKKQHLKIAKISCPFMTLVSVLFFLSFLRVEVPISILLTIMVTLIIPWFLLSYKLYFEETEEFVH